MRKVTRYIGGTCTIEEYTEMKRQAKLLGVPVASLLRILVMMATPEHVKKAVGKTVGKAGEYQFNGGHSPKPVVQKLARLAAITKKSKAGVLRALVIANARLFAWANEESQK